MPVVKTLGDLKEAYFSSHEWLSCAAGSKRVRRPMLDRFTDRFGTVATPLDVLLAPEFRRRLYAWRDTFSATPHQGTNTISAVAAMLGWAYDRGFITDNPAVGVKRLTQVTSHAENIWSVDDLAELYRVSPLPVREVVELALWTGLRQNDVLGLTADHFDRGWLTCVPAKTRHSSGVTVRIPYYLIGPLVDLLNRLVNVPRRAKEPILREYRGAPWTDRYFRDQFTRCRAAAGVDPALRFHDLRGTLITWMIEAGCSDAEVGVISGHSLARGSIRSYAARTKTLAEGAFQKLARHVDSRDRMAAAFRGETKC